MVIIYSFILALLYDIYIYW